MVIVSAEKSKEEIVKFQKLSPSMIYIETHFEEVTERIRYLVTRAPGMGMETLARVIELSDYLDNMPAEHAIQRPILN